MTFRHARLASGLIPDAIVIGSGPNGLVAANVLADAGWDVLVLESQPHYGGAVRSTRPDEPGCAPGFVTDLFSAFHPLAARSPAIGALELDKHGLQWAHAPAVLSHLTPEGASATLWRDLDRTAASVEAWAPGDGEAWRDQARRWQQVRDPLLDSLFRPFPPVRSGARLARKLGVADGLRFARQATMGADRWGRETFDGDGARLLIAGNALHADLSPDAATSALFGWLLAMLAQDVGWPAPVGGAGALTEALVTRLALRGGQVRCSTPVAGVTVSDGAATGVRLADGTTIRAGRAVLADVSAPSLYLDLLGRDVLPDRVWQDLATFTWDDATLKLNWALRSPIPWTSPDVRSAGTVHLGADLPGLARFAADLKGGRMPSEPFLLLGQMTTTDPTRSPAGTESVWAYTHVPQALAGDEDALHRQIERVELVIEDQAPGFRASILGRLPQLPRDLQAANANLVGGATNGGTAGLFQQLVFRPVPGLARPETPVAKLYLASASAHPGGGVHGAPGANAATVALRRAGLSGKLRHLPIDALLKRVHG